MLLLVGAILLVRGSFVGPGRPAAPWRARELALTALAMAAAIFAVQQWGRSLLLQFGPSEFAALILFQLAVAVALARRSLVRAVATALLGLLLATVGTDVETGIARFTLGWEELNDGIPLAVAALGLIVVADAAICLFSPTFFWATYSWLGVGWVSPRIAKSLGIAMRIAAALAAAAACRYAFRLNNSPWDVGEILVFAAFGIACKIFGWNRLVLLLALAQGPLLEEQIRRAMLISRGDPAIFLRWPYSATLLTMAGVMLVVAVVLSVRRSLAPADGNGSAQPPRG